MFYLSKMHFRKRIYSVCFSWAQATNVSLSPAVNPIRAEEPCYEHPMWSFQFVWRQWVLPRGGIVCQRSGWEAVRVDQGLGIYRSTELAMSISLKPCWTVMASEAIRNFRDMERLNQLFGKHLVRRSTVVWGWEACQGKGLEGHYQFAVRPELEHIKNLCSRDELCIVDKTGSASQTQRRYIPGPRIGESW